MKATLIEGLHKLPVELNIIILLENKIERLTRGIVINPVVYNGTQKLRGQTEI